MSKRPSKKDDIAIGLAKTFTNLGFKFEQKPLMAFKFLPNSHRGCDVAHTPRFYIPAYNVYIDTPLNTSDHIESVINGNCDKDGNPIHINYVVIRHNLFGNITKSDMLKTMMLQQKLFTSNFQPSQMTIPEKEALTKEMVLCLTDETFELLRECNWKTHRKSRAPINTDNIHEEIVDILKFLLNIVNLWDMDPKRLMDVFNAKSEKVWNRYRSDY